MKAHRASNRLLRQVAALVVVVASVSVAVPAGAIPGVPLVHIRGTVRDAIGRALPNVAVNDGHQTVLTNASGVYDLPEENLGTYTLEVFRTDTLSATRVVDATLPIDRTADFTLMYRLTQALERTALSVAGGPATTTLTITSRAPNPGTPGQSGGASCVHVTDTRTSATGPATLQSTDPDGSSVWQYELSVPAGAAEGPYTLSAWAADCAATTRLTETALSNYLVDNTAPHIDATSIVPLDGGTASFSPQPLFASLTDERSGIDPASVSFSLIDETLGTSGTIAAPQASFDHATGRARTVPQSLTLGHVYRVSVTVQDSAGNMSTVGQFAEQDGGGFIANTIQPNTTAGSIPPTACTVSNEISLQTGTREVACSNVSLAVDDATTVVSGSRRGFERSYVDHTIPLTAAVVTSSVAGVPLSQSAYRANDSAWNPRTAALSFLMEEPTAEATTYTLDGETVELGTLTTRVPAAWPAGQATLSMPSTASSPSLNACADPFLPSAPPGCTPDALNSRFITTLDSAANVEQVAQEQAEAVGAELREVLQTDGQGIYSGYGPLSAFAALMARSDVVGVGREQLLATDRELLSMQATQPNNTDIPNANMSLSARFDGVRHANGFVSGNWTYSQWITSNRFDNEKLSASAFLLAGDMLWDVADFGSGQCFFGIDARCSQAGKWGAASCSPCNGVWWADGTTRWIPPLPWVPIDNSDKCQVDLVRRELTCHFSVRLQIA